MSTYLTSAASHIKGHAFVIDLGRTAPESVAAEPSTSVHPTNSGDKGKGKESQNPHPPERSGSVSEHHVSVGSYPIVSGPLAMTPGSSKVAAEPSTKTRMQRQNTGSEQPTSSDKGKGKEKQTPQRPGSVFEHAPAANLPESHLSHQGHPASINIFPEHPASDPASHLTHQGHPASGKTTISPFFDRSA